jgi:hypothetical protein
MRISLSCLDAIDNMHRKGFICDFQLTGNGLLWVQEKINIRDGDFCISEYHTFSYTAETNGITYI